MTERFTVDSDGKYWDKIKHEYVSIDGLFRTVEQLDKENARLRFDFKEFKSLLHSLEKENEQLKSHINDTQIAVEIETEKCMQRVFDLIDEKIKFVETCSDMYPSNPDYYRGAFEILKLLKKELQE